MTEKRTPRYRLGPIVPYTIIFGDIVKVEVPCYTISEVSAVYELDARELIDAKYQYYIENGYPEEEAEDYAHCDIQDSLTKYDLEISF